MNNHYFISYVYSNPFGFGATDVWREDPITSFEDIDSLTKLLEGDFKMKGKLPPDAKVVILNWRRFEEAE